VAQIAEPVVPPNILDTAAAEVPGAQPCWERLEVPAR